MRLSESGGLTPGLQMREFSRYASSGARFTLAIDKLEDKLVVSFISSFDQQESSLLAVVSLMHLLSQALKKT